MGATESFKQKKDTDLGFNRISLTAMKRIDNKVAML